MAVTILKDNSSFPSLGGMILSMRSLKTFCNSFVQLKPVENGLCLWNQGQFSRVFTHRDVCEYWEQSPSHFL